MDGNGRSGRAIWLWQMLRQEGGAPLGFLHHFYYQTLEAQDVRKQMNICGND
jgi:Fic family protein